ncbi:unnamed protein product [Arctogadus glacialis]
MVLCLWRGGRGLACSYSISPGLVATYTKTTMIMTTTANVGSTTVATCCRASCMACLRSFLSRDVSFLALPFSCLMVTLPLHSTGTAPPTSLIGSKAHSTSSPRFLFQLPPRPGDLVR